MARGWNSARRASVVLAEALQWNTILSESGSRVDRPSICLGKWNLTRGSSCSVPLKKQEEPDRKSTRLNSSHANISYAVFCLKKKKKNDYEQYPPQHQS